MTVGDGGARAALAPLAEDPARSVVVVDFDGSLAPVVDDPAGAVPDPGAVAVLARLAGAIGRVAVVSGRPVDFLRAALPVDGLILLGQYGVERLDAGVVVVDPQARSWARNVAAAAEEAEGALSGLRVERKAGIAVALHWRQSPALEEEAVALGRRLAASHGLRLEPGRLALELRAPVPVDKGTATRTLVATARAALVAGDDHGDVAAFATVGQLVTEGRLAYGLRVAVASPETPAELLRLADRAVDGPAGLVALLGVLAALVESPG